ncbi:MAG: hypothetical protein M3O84_07865 [Actinomycetota bacterium]|nr:hypothetical protein [Actinomycetota bacterium]
MTERWRNGLEELSRVPMSEGLLERAGNGSTMPDPPGPGPARRVAIAVLALAIFAASGVGVWEALRPGPAPIRPASEGIPQRVYGDTLCIFRSSPEGKLDATAGADSTSDPVAACQALWATGGHAPAPDMIGCVDPAMPSYVSVAEVSSSPDGTCAGLGESPLPDGWDANLAEWRATADAAASVFPGRTNGISCQRDENTAADAWRNALDDHGFTSWKVVIDDANADRPCVNYNVNYDAMEITIVHDTVS